MGPWSLRPEPAPDVIGALLEHVRPALRSNGDEDFVDAQVADVLRRGNGAMRQRSVLGKTGQLTDVVADLARVTAGQDA